MRAMAALRPSLVESGASGPPRRWWLERIPHSEHPLHLALSEDDEGELLVGVGLGSSKSLQAHARRWGAHLEDGGARSGDRSGLGRAPSRAGSQLREYLAGARQNFDLRVLALGTAFEREAWAALIRIPFGETRSYAQQARALAKPGAARAVGRANGRNPAPIVIPCHRVIGSDGSLTGFAGGLGLKRWLLAHEGVRLPSEAGPRLAPPNQLGLF